jgi:hypothetical protein
VKGALGDEDDGEADGSMLLPSSVLSLFFSLFFLCFLCFFVFSVFVSLFVFSLYSASSIRSLPQFVPVFLSWSALLLVQ